MWFDQVWNFLAENWKHIIGIIIVLYILRCAKTNKDCKVWLSAQFEWLKGFFIEDKVPHAPSHKNLIGLAMTAMFCIAFIKTLLYQTTPFVPDIPAGWQIVILGLLGIRALQSAAESKFTNGNSYDAKAEIAKIKAQMGYVEPEPTPEKP